MLNIWIGTLDLRRWSYNTCGITLDLVGVEAKYYGFLECVYMDGLMDACIPVFMMLDIHSRLVVTSLETCIKSNSYWISSQRLLPV